MVRSSLLFLTTVFVSIACLAQAPTAPNLEVERAAMKKLSFLTGKWRGDASMLRAGGQYVEMAQTEEAQYKLDGLILTIEGVGTAKSDGKPVLRALGLISFDDASGSYRMRAFNDGRWLETDVVLGNDGKSLAWGFTLGEARTNSTLRMNDKGEWTEYAELTIGPSAPRKLLELNVRRTADQ
ncbi:MAG: hypothetical protein JO065_01160 [Acidobacteria bacterium]|nr:hypothetical protein [Acidobacteriota bacterium]MBV9436832.1 hypothetical protein [Acidobacteriota bacterium]